MNTAIWNDKRNRIKKQDDAVLKLLEFRGVDDPIEFLRITKKKLHNPYKMKNMKPTVEKIIKGIQQKKKFGIFGDYDCDGVSSTSLWVLVLRDLGADVMYYIPNRFEDGYGVNKKGIDKFVKNNVDIMITCDTGITAIKEVDYAQKQGLDVIITDHHEPQLAEAYEDTLHAIGQIVADESGEEYLIPNTLVVDIKRPDCRYPFKGLAGVGVSFKILCAVCDKIHPSKRAGAYQFMDIVALGTFADMMDVIDENRVIGSLGLDMINHTTNRGLYQLIRANEITGTIVSKDIGWTIAPCINAAGRIVSAEQAVEMMISSNRLDAYRSAKKLVEINKERKELTKTVVEAIIKSIEAEQEKNPTNFIMAYYPGIPEGIVGLIAGRVMNHFYKPSIIMTDSDEEGIYKGSGRSIGGFNLFTTLMGHTAIMEGFGGHAAACGLSVKKENFPKLKEHLEFYADTTLSEKDLQPIVYIDAVVKGDILDIDFVKELSKLEPFGNGNKKPLFMMEDVRVIRSKAVGDAKNHFWALLSDGKRTFSTIGWFLWDKYKHIGEPKSIDVVFFPQLNEYPKDSGKINVQLEIEDIRKHSKKKKR